MPYVYLVAAIVLECIGTYFMKVSQGFTDVGATVACLLLYAVCYWCFSRALVGIPLSVAYATWGALGIVLATFVSAVLFHEGLNPVVGVGIVLSVAGVAAVNVGAGM